MTSPDAESNRPFYHAEYDRYRIIELAYDMERHRAQLTHEEIAARAPFLSASQSATIAHLTRTVNDPRHRIQRRTILVALTWGLRLPRWKVDVLLDLFSGQPLTESEATHFLSSYHSEQYGAGPAGEPDGDADRVPRALRLLRENLRWRWPDDGPVQAAVKFYSAEPSREIEIVRQVHAMEARAGMRLIVTEAPSNLTDPPTEYAAWLRSEILSRQPDALALMPEEQLLERFELATQRHAQFLLNLREYGEAVIHSLPYLQQMVGHADPVIRERSRRQVRRLIELLETYEQFHVGLADTKPLLELEVKSFDWAMLRGTGTLLQGASAWGPRDLEWTDPSIVLLMVESFWSSYYSLSPAHRERHSVIEALRRCLEPS